MVMVAKETYGVKSPIHVAWKRIYTILEQLGTDGMSSEEEDMDEIGHPCLRVKEMEWRVPLNTILRLVDGIRARYPKYFNSAGAPTRRRLPGGGKSKRPSPQKMPRVLYKQSWLAARSRWELEDLEPSSVQVLFPDSHVLADLDRVST